ncbi:GGDEF domain-containing protein [Acuticoccus kandeliae]|uniref:GGDEF domain-containing protein n=1 Tax=Acuticoccus kandeliae TaxID=2073160 RepID=UPI000D3E7326|nr:GGDEF domain-containing protein [Acuticoccus kandeliae]
MRLYQALDTCFPRSLSMKMFMVAFVGTHVPLIAAVAFVLLDRDEPVPVAFLVTLLLATVVGSVVTMAGLRFLLRPVIWASRAMESYADRRQLPRLPRHFQDEAGILMRHTQSMIEHAERTITQTEQLASRDPLTGLLNRRGLRSVEAFTRVVEKVPIVILFDLDHFKSINDTHGHDVGDRVLVGVAHAIRVSTRPEDVSARLGGDEFVVFALVEAFEDGAGLAQRISEEIARTVRVAGRAVTISAGVAKMHRRHDKDAIEDAIVRADRALYLSKRNGRGRVHVDEGEDEVVA